jgi:hypothetical protein
MERNNDENEIILEQQPECDYHVVIRDRKFMSRDIGEIYPKCISDRGNLVQVYCLYDVNDKLIAIEMNEEYMENITTMVHLHKLRDGAIDKWREDELGIDPKYVEESKLKARGQELKEARNRQEREEKSKTGNGDLEK